VAALPGLRLCCSIIPADLVSWDLSTSNYFFHRLTTLSPPNATPLLNRYEPPPYGPGTSLNRPSYGVVEAKPFFIQQLSRRPPGLLIAGSIVAFGIIAYIPISEFTHL